MIRVLLTTGGQSAIRAFLEVPQEIYDPVDNGLCPRLSRVVNDCAPLSREHLVGVVTPNESRENRNSHSNLWQT